MRTLYSVFITLFLVVKLLPGAAPDSSKIGPGVVFYHDYRAEGPWHIYITKVDLSERWIDVIAHKAHGELNGRLPVSEQMAEADNDSIRVVAAINGDFYEADGSPTGIHVQNGNILSKPTGRSVFFLDENEDPHIEVLEFPYSYRVIHAIGGGPRIVRDGQVSVENKVESIGDSFATARHPRTALGFSADSTTLFLFAVDGRQPGYSVGMSLYELAGYMLKWGIWQGMNLDGGGSTTMVIGDNVANRPSDATGERPVSNSLMVISKAPQSAPVEIDLMADSLVVLTASETVLNYHARDRYYNPVVPHEITWNVSGSEAGKIDTYGTFRSVAQEAEGWIYVETARLRDSMYVEVLKPDSLYFAKPAMRLMPGEQQPLQLFATDKKGNVYKLDAARITFKKETDLLTVSGDTLTAAQAGRTNLSAHYQGLSAKLNVKITEPLAQQIAGFADTSNYSSGGLYVESKRLLPDAVNGREALSLEYALTGGGTSALYLECAFELPGVVKRLFMNVYGDGRGHWLRSEFEDADGETFIANWTAESGVTWEGWRELMLSHGEIQPHWRNITATLDWPLKLTRIYLVERDPEKKGSGRLLFSNLKAFYLNP